MARQKLKQGRRWYVIHTQSGKEDAVKKALQQRIDTYDLQEYIFSVEVPKETVIEVKKGEQTEVERPIHPGYVYVEMIVTDKSWFVIRSTPNVTGFLGAGTTPVPVSEEEMAEIKRQTGKGHARVEVPCQKDDLVRIMNGPFSGYEAKVIDVDPEKGRVNVIVNLFQRDTPLELGFDEIKRVI